MNHCKVIKDLLPLYVENLTSDESNRYIEEHIDSCDDCKNELRRIEQDIPIHEVPYTQMEAEDQELIRDIKRRVKNKTFLVALIGILIGLVLAVPFFPFTITGGVVLILIVGVIIYVMH